MKKLVLFLLSGIVLFGAQLQQATPFMAEVEGTIPIEYIDANPAMVTLRIPVDLDPPPIGLHIDGYVVESGYTMHCYLYVKDGALPSVTKISSGKKTLLIKWNNIPIDLQFTLKKYKCTVNFNMRGGTWKAFESIGDITSSYIPMVTDTF